MQEKSVAQVSGPSWWVRLSSLHHGALVLTGLWEVFVLGIAKQGQGFASLGLHLCLLFPQLSYGDFSETQGQGRGTPFTCCLHTLEIF